MALLALLLASGPVAFAPLVGSALLDFAPVQLGEHGVKRVLVVGDLDQPLGELVLGQLTQLRGELFSLALLGLDPLALGLLLGGEPFAFASACLFGGDGVEALLLDGALADLLGEILAPAPSSLHGAVPEVDLRAVALAVESGLVDVLADLRLKRPDSKGRTRRSQAERCAERVVPGVILALPSWPMELRTVITSG